jgi:hypothetical protein
MFRLRKAETKKHPKAPFGGKILARVIKR